MWKTNKLAGLLRNKQPSLGVWMTLCDPGIAVILAHTGYDWLLIDTEHNPFTEAQLQSIFFALGDKTITPVVRVRNNDPSLIKFALDNGAQGVFVPMIEDAAAARQAVKNAKYPPLGRRGYGPLRVTEFWTHKKAFDENPNEQLLLIVQIEQVGAVEEIDQIVRTAGIDGIFIGPADLSVSLGCPGELNHPKVQDTIERIIAAANAAGMVWGTIAADADDCARRVRQGGRLMTLGSDNRFLKQGAAKMVQMCKAALREQGLRVYDD